MKFSSIRNRLCELWTFLLRWPWKKIGSIGWDSGHWFASSGTATFTDSQDVAEEIPFSDRINGKWDFRSWKAGQIRYSWCIKWRHQRSLSEINDRRPGHVSISLKKIFFPSPECVNWWLVNKEIQLCGKVFLSLTTKERFRRIATEN